MPEVLQPGSSPNERFLAGHVPEGTHARMRFGNSFLVSLTTHVAGFFLILFLVSRMPAPDPYTPPERLPDGIIWTQSPGPGGGGGGGGNKSPDPPRKAELPGRDKVTVPVAKAPKPAPEPPKPEEPKPEQRMNIPAVTTSAGVQQLPGALTGVPSAPSLGSGTGTGAGTGSGSGIGSGKGSGLGEGYGGGTGGGAYRPGNGVMMPVVVSEVKPSYTADAMRAKIQGVVLVEAVVLPDGGVGQVQIVRSLDPTFGLDQEAVKAVKRWRFRPGTRMGQPVPVLVEIELTFTLR